MYFVEVLRQRGCFDVSLEVAARIIGIYNTNSVESGVCRQLSRVNHSCLPSAELATNPELETQDLRAVRHIKPGEEITANYADLEDGLNQAASSDLYYHKSQNMKHLVEKYSFLVPYSIWYGTLEA